MTTAKMSPLRRRMVEDTQISTGPRALPAVPPAFPRMLAAARAARRLRFFGDRATAVRFKSANPWQLAEITLILAALRDLDATPAVIARSRLHRGSVRITVGKLMKPVSYWIAGSSPAMTAGVWHVWARRIPGLTGQQWQSCRACRSRRLHRAATQGRLGRLCQGPLRRARGSARLSQPLHPPRRHRQRARGSARLSQPLHPPRRHRQQPARRMPPPRPASENFTKYALRAMASFGDSRQTGIAGQCRLYRVSRPETFQLPGYGLCCIAQASLGGCNASRPQDPGHVELFPSPITCG
jgi:hypothetical protein